jgi:hypothetical protein
MEEGILSNLKKKMKILQLMAQNLSALTERQSSKPDLIRRRWPDNDPLSAVNGNLNYKDNFGIPLLQGFYSLYKAFWEVLYTEFHSV